MAWCPFADHKPIPENATEPKIKPYALIWHSQAGYGSLYGYWKRGDITLESTFWIGLDGTIEQYMDTERQADANGEANGFRGPDGLLWGAGSIEHESSPSATEPFTPEQEAATIRLGRWYCETHDIPAVRMATPKSKGLGWHVMFGAPGPWTPSRGKTCPGPARIQQLKSVIFPAIASNEGDGFLSDLSPTEQREAYNILKQLENDYLTKGKSMRQVILDIEQRTEDLVTGKRPQQKRP